MGEVPRPMMAPPMLGPMPGLARAPPVLTDPRTGRQLRFNHATRASVGMPTPVLTGPGIVPVMQIPQPSVSFAAGSFLEKCDYCGTDLGGPLATNLSQNPALLLACTHVLCATCFAQIRQLDNLRICTLCSRAVSFTHVPSIESERIELCGVPGCITQGVVTAACAECNCAMCHSCIQAHNSVYASHNIGPMPHNLANPAFCTEHYQPFDKLCSCKKLMCRRCPPHRQCRITTRQTMESSLSEKPIELVDMNEMIKGLQSYERLEQVQLNNMKVEVVSHAQYLCQQIINRVGEFEKALAVAEARRHAEFVNIQHRVRANQARIQRLNELHVRLGRIQHDDALKLRLAGYMEECCRAISDDRRILREMVQETCRQTVRVNVELKTRQLSNFFLDWIRLSCKRENGEFAPVPLIPSTPEDRWMKHAPPPPKTLRDSINNLGTMNPTLLREQLNHRPPRPHPPHTTVSSSHFPSAVSSTVPPTSIFPPQLQTMTATSSANVARLVQPVVSTPDHTTAAILAHLSAAEVEMEAERQKRERIKTAQAALATAFISHNNSHNHQNNHSFPSTSTVPTSQSSQSPELVYTPPPSDILDPSQHEVVELSDDEGQSSHEKLDAQDSPVLPEGDAASGNLYVRPEPEDDEKQPSTSSAGSVVIPTITISPASVENGTRSSTPGSTGSNGNNNTSKTTVPPPTQTTAEKHEPLKLIIRRTSAPTQDGPSTSTATHTVIVPPHLSAILNNHGDEKRKRNADGKDGKSRRKRARKHEVKSEEDRWDDYCYVCRQGTDDITGSLGCCFSCPHVYHRMCHAPPVPTRMEDLPDDWRCTLCQPTTEVKYFNWDREMDENEKMICYKMILRLFKTKPELVEPFIKPVPEDLTNYHAVIKRPMCLEWVVRGLSDDSSTFRILTFRQFIDAMNQIFKNASIFNQPNSAIIAAARDVWKRYQEAAVEFAPKTLERLWLFHSLYNRGDEEETPDPTSSTAPLFNTGSTNVKTESV